MDVAIIIVSWNTKELLQKCLASVHKYGKNVNPEVWVVDNASYDGSAEMVARKFPLVKLLTNQQNLGFAKANNQALKKTKKEFVMLLNPDTQITADIFNPLINCLEGDETVAACGPKMLGLDNKLQHQGFYRRAPSILQALLFYTDLHRITLKNKYLRSRFWESDVESKKTIEVDQIPGAGFFSRRKVLQDLNFFDEDYPLWFEDVDLCFRLKKAGFKLMYVPESEIIHVGGAAFYKWEDRMRKETRFWKSLFIYFEKNRDSVSNLLIKLIILSNLIFLVASRSIMQLFDFKSDRGKFIKLEWTILIKLLT